MKKTLLISCVLLTITSCSSFTSTDILIGELPVNDKSVSDEILCLTAFTSEVKIPKSQIQQDIIKEISRRNIRLEQCASYVVSNAGGVNSFCSDLNSGYVKGDSVRMPSFGNYITLQDMFAVQNTLGIDCNTNRYIEEYNKIKELNAISPPSDFSKGWQMFQPKTNTVNCMSVGSSTMCNDTKGNLLNINRW
ncbi:hypothetical protein [Haemophilus haemolyticus]|uniref:hypothetical protein n=1 Tax=Haemophilus haemolyticus TaxID=726 RepID=UPI000E0D12F0|nr:hypothetical protein [Haemophilus haemolyticus]